MTSPDESLAGRYLAAQLAGNAREALRLVLEDGLGKGIPAEDLHVKVIGEAQRELGRLWEANRISVADEHQATAISQLVLSHLYTQLPRPARFGKTILVSCVEGELHDMSARIASDLLESSGFDVLFLGANMPTDVLVKKILAAKPDALALAYTMIFHVDTMRTTIGRVRAEVGDLPIFVGGDSLVDPSELAALPGVHVSRGSALDLVALAKRVLGVSP